MEPSKTLTEDKNLWEDIRDTVRGGFHDLRNVGDELARQGRLRMDIFQAERRLKTAFEDLGRAVHARMAEAHALSTEDPTLAELNVRIGYYTGELKRLHDELQHCGGAMN